MLIFIISTICPHSCSSVCCGFSIWNLLGVNCGSQVKVPCSRARKFKLESFNKLIWCCAEGGERWDVSVSQPRRERTETLLSNSWQEK